jgi:hypothetical protein
MGLAQPASEAAGHTYLSRSSSLMLAIFMWPQVVVVVAALQMMPLVRLDYGDLCCR